MRVNVNVKQNYGAYMRIVAALKRATALPLVLAAKPNKGRVFGSLSLDSEVSEKLHVDADKNVKNVSHYGVKLRARELCGEPLLRFDADGAAHHNQFDHIPLAERQVTTPHFHRFNEDGIEVAFKTAALSDPATLRSIHQDMNVGFRHFAAEANIQAESAILVVEEQMSLLPTDSDPTAGVTFK
jgi:hypothetical protein